jgi:hypothetical protein
VAVDQDSRLIVGHRLSNQPTDRHEALRPPAPEASLLLKMAYKLRTDIGKQIYGLRKSTVKPIIGIIKEVLGFRQFSLRESEAIVGEWGLVCLAYNLKRLHVLLKEEWPAAVINLAG